jgi:signal transduction histidine kinase
MTEDGGRAVHEEIMPVRHPTGATWLALAVVISTLSGVALLLSRGAIPSPILILWVLMIGVVELLPVTTWGGVQVSLGFPLLIAVAFRYPAGQAGLVALVGLSDPREFRREVSLLQALFNRCQVAAAVLAASGTFHSLSSVSKPLSGMVPVAILATVVDFTINVSIVSVVVGLVHHTSIFGVARRLLGRGQEFLISYIGLGLLGTVLAKLDSIRGVGLWSVATVLAPLLLARQMFLRSQALEEAHKELQEREQVLRALSNTMAQERADERMQIAGYLHDDLAQILFRLSIQVDVARKQLDRGNYEETAASLEKIRKAKQDTSDRVRALIRDLHRSPIGPRGLAEAIQSFTDEVARDAPTQFHTDVGDIPLPAPIALLIFHITGEGVMNALKHAQASDMWITVRAIDDSIELIIKDNGRGFDMVAPAPEGHFGMAMMRERATVGGGSFDVSSRPGAGTTITARFPISLLHTEGSQDEPAEPGRNTWSAPAEDRPPSPRSGRDVRTTSA